MASKNTQKILIIVGVVALVLVIVCAGGAYAVYTLLRSATEASEKVVVQFNADYNSKNYQAIFNTFGSELQQEVPLDKLTAMLDFVHEKNGKFSSSSSTGWQVNSVNGVTMVSLTYRATYERYTGSQEFVLREINGAPRIVGFHLPTPVSMEP